MRLSSICIVIIMSIFASDPAFSEGQSAKEFTFKVEKDLKYLIHVPEGYDADETKKWPFVLFLHGAGERGNDLDKVKVHGPPKLIESGQKLPFIVVSPQCPSGQWWETDVLMALIESLEKTHRIDPDRIYVTGLSMGGYGTWAMAMRYPEKFAAIVPICGGGIPYKTRFISKLPIWVFHGDADSAVSISESEKLVEALKKHGSQVKFTIYPGVGHHSWTPTYDNPEVFKWLLAQKKTKPEAK